MAPTILVLADPADPMLAPLRSFDAGVTFVIGDRLEAFDAASASAEAILVWSGGRALLERVLAAFPRVRWVHSWAAGVEGLLFPALAQRGVTLTNARGVYSRSLAEFALGAMLYFAKDLARMKRSQAAERWEPFDVQVLQGATLGILGYGDIGRAGATLGRAFGMELLACRRRPELSREDPLQPELVSSTRAVCERADYLVLAAPLTPETRHMLAAPELAAMKPSAVLVNIGRGAVIDEAALVGALQRGALKGAALDVFETEPLAEGHPLFALPNVLVSPHCADHTATWRNDALRCFLENLGRFRTGQPLQNVVDQARGY